AHRHFATVAADGRCRRRTVDCRARRGIRRDRRRRHRGTRESRVSDALRHGAGVRPGHGADCRAIDRDRAAARTARRRRRLMAASARRDPVAVSPMTSFGLAWRSTRRYRVRAILAVAGVAIIGALLFDMLLLSRGLLESFADLLR